MSELNKESLAMKRHYLKILNYFRKAKNNALQLELILMKGYNLTTEDKAVLADTLAQEKANYNKLGEESSTLYKIYDNMIKS
jgi:hypothetical protein